MPPEIADGAHQHEFDAAEPHVHLRALQRIAAEERPVRMKLFKVPADRYAFGNGCAVVEFKHRRLAERILLRNSSDLCSRFTSATSSSGRSIPFSAAKTRTRRGFGAGMAEL